MSGTKRPNNDELRKAQTNVKETLRRVVHDGETITITGDDDQPVAVILPYQTYENMKAHLA